MPFRVPTTRVQLLRVLSAKADVSQTKAAAVWDAMLALAREGVSKDGSFSFPGLGKLERVERKARRAYDIATGRRVRLAAKTDLVFRVSKIAKDAILPAAPAPQAPKAPPAKAAKAHTTAVSVRRIRSPKETRRKPAASKRRSS